MNNFRKEQMRLAVLMEITDTPKRNGKIIKGAESRLILDDEYNRLMKNGKQSIGSKELQFILYYIKRDKLANMPGRGLYSESAETVNERFKAASAFIEYIDTEATPEDVFILKTDTINELRKIIENKSTVVKLTDNKQVEEKDRPVSTEISKDKKPKLKEKKDTAEKQVENNEDTK